jgi:putative sterol carrier protein/GNAT superfamily N-acetyltransferase
MPQERIRILVDRSRDSEWAGELVDIEPDTVYWATDNRDYLSWSVLKNYDVLTICGCSPLYHRDEEIMAIKRFVEAGGGLLLASSTSRFERDVGRPISEMGINKLARLFGAEFLPLDRCKGKMKVDDDLLRGYPKENLRLLHCGALAESELELDDIPISNCGIISVPENAQVFLEHSETKEPIGACVSFGKGRVLLINELEFSQENQRTCRAFIDWLAYNRISKVEGDEAIPDEIAVDEQVKQDGKIKIYYTDLVKDRVDTCLEFAKKITEKLVGMFSVSSDMTWNIKLNTSCTHGRSWWDAVLHIGAFMSDSKLAYALGVEMMSLLDVVALYDLMRYAGFSYDAQAKYFGMMAMKLLGFKREAEEMYAEIVRQFKEKDATGKEFDIAKTYPYEYHAKQLWILNTLTEKHGQDLLARFIKAIPDTEDPYKNMPRHIFSAMDIFIYHLSRALETDLYPWFQEIGTTVHPLPLHPNESDEFKNGVRQYLKNVIGDKAASASDRIDAVLCLIDIYDKENKPLSNLMDELDSDDKYERLVAAVRLSRLSDSRATYALEDMTSDEDDRTLAAIAALELVRQGKTTPWPPLIRGKTSAADRLLEIARGQDYRFQLDAGYALHKIGHSKAEELSFRNLRNENGEPVVEMKVEYDGYLKLSPMVAKRKVASIFSSSQVAHFPENTHVTVVVVDWVHTAPQYRRKGFSRWTMQETMAHKAVRRCSCAFLGTGTRNTAHPMYRSFGFVDTSLTEAFSKELREEKAKVIDGLVIRPYSPGDEVKMANLANECYSDLLGVGHKRARRMRSNSHIKIAEKDGEMQGYVWASGGRSKEEAHLEELCLKNTDSRDDIGAALLCALHNEMFSHGYKKITMARETLLELDFLRKLLHNFGYSSLKQWPTGHVEMFKIINLPMLLTEFSPLLSKRLKDSDYKDWHGKLGIAGEQHKASIIIKDGEISVSEEVLEDSDILLSADDDTITKIIAGVMTPFEAYLQTELNIQPMVNDKLIGLLETLFPRIPKQD